MAGAAQGAQHEFWQPPIQAAETPARSELVEACDRCGTEFIVDSRFCHACGTVRPGSAPARPWLATGLNTFAGAAKSFAGVGDRLALGTASFLALLGGVACILGALGVGIIFSARTVLDWQAVQLWRIEWLLGAVAMFGAGCLLKRPR